MVPFEFASVLLLVAMMERSYCQKKKKQRNNMNNILNEIGIENYIFLSTILFLYWGLLLYRRNAIIVFMSVEIMLNAVNLLCCIFYLSPRCTRTNFCLFSMAVAAEVAVGLAILVSIFRNLGSIDINNFKT
jgi:NADH-quinone oxidoreductase subunit K